MEFLIRQCNDESYMDPWLMLGVADGDISYGCMDLNEVDDYYIEDDQFKSLVGLFLRAMRNAGNDVGLYIGGVTADIHTKA